MKRYSIGLCAALLCLGALAGAAHAADIADGIDYSTPAPTVWISSPAAGELFAGAVSVAASASSPLGVAAVQFFVDGSSLSAPMNAEPYSASWNTAALADGQHSLTAVAWDTAGIASTSTAVLVTLENAAPALSAVGASAVASSSATVTWLTNENATAQVLFGATNVYGSTTAVAPALTVRHSVALTGLAPGTLYHYQAVSQNAAGVMAVSTDAFFSTLAFSTPVAAPAAATASLPSDVLFSDNFDRLDGLITNEYAFWHAGVPGLAVSPDWQMDSGSFFVQGGNGWTGVPDGVGPNAASSNGTDSAVFRVTTKRTNFANVAVSFGLLNQGLSTSSRTPEQAYDGCHFMLRYQSEYNLYYLSINRRDNTVIIKKKVAGGPTNGGTYYDLSPSMPYNVPYNVWQQVKAAVFTNSDGSVTLQLFAGGNLLVSAVDNGTIGGPPILAAGAVGLRGDNANLKFSSFTVSAIGVAPAGQAPAPRPGAVAGPVLEAKAPQRFLSPALADGINDDAVFGPDAKEVSVFDLRGKRLFHGTRDASGPALIWNCKDSSGQIVESGVYIAQIMTFENNREYQKFAVVK